MAISRLPDVESVDVSLRRAAADVRLEPGNTITLAQLRKLVKDNGFTSGNITVTATGVLIERDGAPALDVSRLNVVWPLVRDPKQPKAYDEAAARAKDNQRVAIEVTGVIAPPKNANQPDRLMVTSLNETATSR